MIPQTNLLGSNKGSCCRWIYMGGNVWRYVCGPGLCTGGGGTRVNNPGGGLLGDASLDQLRSDWTNALLDAQSQLSYWMDQLSQDPQDATSQSEVTKYQALITTYTNLLAMNQNQINSIGSQPGGFLSYINNAWASINNTLQNFSNYASSVLTNSGTSSGTSNLFNTNPTAGGNYFTQPSIGGLPVWSVLLLGGAGVWLVYDNVIKHKKGSQHRIQNRSRKRYHRHKR